MAIGGVLPLRMQQPAIPAITMLQPWASMVVAGLKPLETRGWDTSYRGRMAIHASKSTRGLHFCRTGPIADVLAAAGLTVENLPLGCIVGEVNLDDIRDLRSADSDHGGDFGWLIDGRMVWEMSGPRKYPKPIPARGQIGLWFWEPSVSLGSP